MFQSLCLLGLSANHPAVLFSHTKSAPTPTTSQSAVSLITNQHQPSATAKRTQRMIFDREHLTFWTILTEPFFNNRICSVATSKLNYCKNRRPGIFIHMCIEISGNVKFWRNKHVWFKHGAYSENHFTDRSFMHIETLTETQTRFST